MPDTPASGTATPDWAALDDAVRRAGLDSPVLALDLDLLDANIADLRRRAAGVPIRVASKSLRVRSMIERVLDRPGYAGVLAFDVTEAHWLATESGVTDVLLGYPTAKREALAALCADDLACRRVTLLVDDPAQLDLVDAVAPPSQRPTIRVAIDLDASLRAAGGRVHLGVHRSPIHSVAQATALARTIVGRSGFALVGVMSYEAQVAGLANHVDGKFVTNTAVSAIQAVSMTEIRRRRGKVISALREIADLEFVNAGGTGSLEETAKDAAVTDIAAGSGLFGGHLFDNYRRFRPAPAMSFGLDVVRRPSEEIVTCAGGGWIASGPPATDRLPRPVWPEGLEYIATEAAGEVQTPLVGPAARTLRVGDRVWFRHTKSGEVAERADRVALIRRDARGTADVVDVVPTYRGERKCFL
ncbi:alanine racemase [Gordonia hydrophobica]|uniref:Alanine racemase n=1 Tax=Gordonia hydrophobica TaxID=40516 RepID=A0ABZ2U3L3_9ACTN|nr:alanine racemase [Gordonia hydrophobica]MBM7367468.1 D-serine deaminase-like pyridoxal phosphate-dependent protein [Gordonia hydrophobica]